MKKCSDRPRSTNVLNPSVRDLLLVRYGFQGGGPCSNTTLIHYEGKLKVVPSVGPSVVDETASVVASSYGVHGRTHKEAESNVDTDKTYTSRRTTKRIGLDGGPTRSSSLLLY